MVRLHLSGYVALTLVGALLWGDARACYWDSDTIAMERRRFPGVGELIAGKFLRHSEAFYRWRIQDRLTRLEGEPENVGWLDDLAVAYDKVGEHEKAIETIRRKDAIRPGLYETEANLGTFLIHAGRLEEGLVHIRRAIELNPDAHFGREVVQQRLVEYVLEVRGAGHAGLPLDQRSCAEGTRAVLNQPDLEGRMLHPRRPYLCSFRKPNGFTAFAASHGLTVEAALKGVMGMMKFGNARSPVLLEALGDLLLMSRARRRDAKLLAARAYLRASYEVQDEGARAVYRAKALLALTGHRRPTLRRLESSFRRELARAERYSAGIQRNEERWIRRGRDPERAFRRRYYRQVR